MSVSQAGYQMSLCNINIACQEKEGLCLTLWLTLQKKKGGGAVAAGDNEPRGHCDGCGGAP